MKNQVKSYQTPKLGKNIFGLLLKELLTRRSSQTSHPFLTTTHVTNFQQKGKIFNEYFADQWKIHDNGSVLPEFVSKTNATLSHINVTTEQIVNIIQKYSAKKAHGCDEISQCYNFVLLKLRFLLV